MAKAPIWFVPDAAKGWTLKLRDTAREDFEQLAWSTSTSNTPPVLCARCFGRMLPHPRLTLLHPAGKQAALCFDCFDVMFRLI
jgi:hypothetical protein